MTDNKYSQVPTSADTTVQVCRVYSLIEQLHRDIQQIREEMLKAEDNGTMSEEYLASVAKKHDEVQGRITAYAVELGLEEELEAHRAAEAAAKASAASQGVGPSEPLETDDSSDDDGLVHYIFDEDIEDDDDATLIGTDYEDDYFQGYSDFDEWSGYSLEDDGGECEEQGGDLEVEGSGVDTRPNSGDETNEVDDSESESADEFSGGSKPSTLYDTDDDEDFGYPLCKFQANTETEVHHPHFPEEDNHEENERTISFEQPWAAEQRSYPTSFNVGYYYHQTPQTSHPPAPQVEERSTRECCLEHYQQDLEALGSTNAIRLQQARTEAVSYPLPVILNDLGVNGLAHAGFNERATDAYHILELRERKKHISDLEPFHRTYVRHHTLERSSFTIIVEEEEEKPAEEAEQDEQEEDDFQWEDEGDDRGSRKSSSDSDFDPDRPISPFELPPPLSPIPPPRATITPPPPYTRNHDHHTQSPPVHLPTDPSDPSYPLSTALSARIHSDAIHNAHITRIRNHTDHIVHLEAANLIQNSIIRNLLLNNNINGDVNDHPADSESPETASILITRIHDLESELAARNDFIANQARQITHLEEHTDLQSDSISILQNCIAMLREENAFLRRAEASMAVTMDGLMDRVGDLEDDVVRWEANVHG